MRKCLNCEHLADVFGNFVQCLKTGRFVDFYYWTGACDPKCPLLDDADMERFEQLHGGERKEE